MPKAPDSKGKTRVPSQSTVKRSKATSLKKQSAAPATEKPPAVLIGGRVDAAQVLKACKALAAYTERRLSANQNELPLSGSNSLGASKDADHTVWLQITVKQLDTKRQIKPARIALAHPLLDQDAAVCLLTKDPQREYKDLLMEKNITLVNRVVGVEKLKGKFRPFDARRQLVRDHDLFLADERIVPMLPKLCGSVFYKDRKFPIPVDLTNKKRLAEAIERAVASTYYMQNKGSCSTIKVGFLHRHSPQELVDNIAQALPAVVARIPGKWANVQNIEIKTGKSAALPVWNCRLTEGHGDDVRWAASEELSEPEAPKRPQAEPKAERVKTKAKRVRTAEP
ncbi:proteasome-interacting protein cic1 [Malassezia nana]|uniref:Ribosomal L1 domain-containing protein 1 n=1 Tax=Malassezia nana TaxID=180528 RepID=A0AAF0EIV4_9BASI|nr:proteasome-interacting protein cic1 [Malassezia nana]